MEGLLYVMSADEALIHTHEINIYDVIHEKEELGLCPGRLRNHLMHLLKRRHVWIIVCKPAYDVLHSGLSRIVGTEAVSH